MLSAGKIATNDSYDMRYLSYRSYQNAIGGEDSYEDSYHVIARAIT